MKATKLLLISVLILLSFSLFGYQRSFFSLVSPTELGFLEGEISVQHRFRGAVDNKPFDNFFGMDSGANTALFYRQALIKRLELKLGYTRENKEYTVDASWSFLKKEFPVQMQANLEFFAYDDVFNPSERHENILLMVSAQNKPQWDRFIMNINLGFEAENTRFVTGIGVGVIILNPLTWMVEYYPVLDRNIAPNDVQVQLRKHDNWSTGIKYDTGGHQFMFMLGTSEAMTLRQSSMGSFTKDIKFGFNVKRNIGF